MEVRFCEPADIRCRWETANDLLEGLALVLDSSAVSSGSSAGVVVTPGTGEVTFTGYAPEVVTGPIA